MEPMEAIAYLIHAVVAGLWAGGVLFVTVAVVPLARNGDINAAPLNHLAGWLVRLSRLSSVLLLATGAYLAAAIYTAESLVETTPGQLILGMVGLWLLLTATVEVGAGKLRRGTAQTKVREPGRLARPWLLAASGCAIGLLAVGGLLSAHRLGFLGA